MHLPGREGPAAVVYPFERWGCELTGDHGRLYGLYERRHFAGDCAGPAGAAGVACRCAWLERGPYNLQTMVGNYVLADEQGVPTSMGKYYDLPVFGLGGSTDSKVLDQQSGFEVAISLMTSLLHGANIVHDVGFMDAGMQGSMQVMAIANDMLGFLRAATRGVEVNDETLALEVIEELGPTGRYLDHEHTLRHFRKPFYSKLADKNLYSVWQKRGSKTMEARAAEMIDSILAEHKPEALPGDVQQAIKGIVEREQARVADEDKN
jgi:trimethylamine---corrinoid protein Co-methyltransferase